MALTIEEIFVGPLPPGRVADPFRYGWRYVRRERPDGTHDYEQVPLTLEDVLHPQEGDHVTHSSAHQRRHSLQ